MPGQRQVRWVHRGQVHVVQRVRAARHHGPNPLLSFAPSLLTWGSAVQMSQDTFIVQGMPGVWDVHCQYEAGGTGIGPFPDLVSCSAHGNL